MKSQRQKLLSNALRCLQSALDRSTRVCDIEVVQVNLATRVTVKFTRVFNHEVIESVELKIAHITRGAG